MLATVRVRPEVKIIKHIIEKILYRRTNIVIIRIEASRAQPSVYGLVENIKCIIEKKIM